MLIVPGEGRYFEEGRAAVEEMGEPLTWGELAALLEQRKLPS